MDEKILFSSESIQVLKTKLLDFVLKFDDVN